MKAFVITVLIYCAIDFLINIGFLSRGILPNRTSADLVINICVAVLTIGWALWILGGNV